MANVGDVEYKYGRVYILTQPDAGQGPPTWRVSNPDELAGPGGGAGGGGVLYDFDGVPPINVNTTPGTGSNPTIVETSMDIQQLDDRAK